MTHPVWLVVLLLAGLVIVHGLGLHLVRRRRLFPWLGAGAVVLMLLIHLGAAGYLMRMMVR